MPSATNANAMISPAKMVSAMTAPASVEITPTPITGSALPEKPHMIAGDDCGAFLLGSDLVHDLQAATVTKTGRYGTERGRYNQ